MSTDSWRRLAFAHRTRYPAAAAALLAHHLVCLKPRESERQRLTSWSMAVDPAPDEVPVEYLDGYGNWRHAFGHGVLRDGLSVTSEGVVERSLAPPSPPSPACRWEAVREALRWRPGEAQPQASEFVLGTPLAPKAPELAAWSAAIFLPGRPLGEAVLALLRQTHAELRYRPAATDVATTALQALQRGEGVCQDLAHLMIAACRTQGLAARYVSGYLLTHPPAGQPRLIGADASHAWVEVWWPGGGEAGGTGRWWALDPTNDCAVGPDHLELAWGRDYADVAPLRGVVQGPATPAPEVAVTVAPIG